MRPLSPAQPITAHFAHAGNGRDDALDLGRRDPLAGTLSMSSVRPRRQKVAVGLLDRLVAGHEPLAAEGATVASARCQ